MTQPRPLATFLPKLLASREIRAACKEQFDVYAKELLGNAKAGDADEFLEWFEEWRMGATKTVATIEAAAPDDDVFEIVVHQSGPLFWIEAPGFDDICYFESGADAEAHAESEFATYIDELQERREEKLREEEEEEEEEEEDDDYDDADPDADGDSNDGGSSPTYADRK